MSVKLTATAPARVEAQCKEALALSLRRKGLSYRQIADKMEISREYATRLVRRSLEELATEAHEDAEAIRSIELIRLDAILIPMQAAAEQGNQGAVDRVLRIMERRAKLLGLDAPAKSEVEQTGVTWIVTLGGKPVIDVTPSPSLLVDATNADHDPTA